VYVGDFADIHVIDADGTNQTQLTHDTALNRFATWSPDGLRIAFTSDRDGDEEIYVMNADGTGVARITHSPGLDVVEAWRR
jgi:Tol biopolymer transport system component